MSLAVPGVAELSPVSRACEAVYCAPGQAMGYLCAARANLAMHDAQTDANIAQTCRAACAEELATR